MRFWLLAYAAVLDMIGAARVTAFKSKKAPAPDPMIAQTAQMQYQLGQEQLNLARQQYEDQKAESARLAPLTERLMQGQIDFADLQMEAGRQSLDDYNTLYRPMQERIFAEAGTAGSQAEQDAAAGRAGADVQRQLDVQRQTSAQQMASMGVNPNSGRFAGMDRSTQVMGAAARAGAQNQAAQIERQRGDQMRMAALGIGQGLASQSMAQGGAAQGMQGGAVQQGMVPNQMNIQAYQGLMGGLNTGANTMGNAAQIMQSQYQNAMTAHQQAQSGRNAAMGGIAQLGMTALTVF